MLLVETAKNRVIQNGTFQYKQATFTANPKAFALMSNGLYSNKIQSLLREVGCNAADAHAAAGNPDPIEVTLPNRIEPTLVIKDYGTGLSPERLEEIYLNYFLSDKEGSNDFTGCFGLGSKSPFAYTDSFTVETRHNGVKTVYNAIIGEDRVPAIAKLGECPTEERNGLTVKVPVNASDITTFVNEARTIFSRFKVRPTVTGNDAFAFRDKPEFLHQTETYAVYKEKTHGKSYIVMGNVCYPLSVYEATNNSTLRQMLNWGVELYVNIGDIDITPSREAVQYGKTTKAFLERTLQKVYDDFCKHLTDSVKTAKTIWEARRKLYDIQHGFTDGFTIPAEWDGKKLESKVKKEYKTVDGATVCLGKMENVYDKARRSDAVVLRRESVEEIVANGKPIYLLDGRGGLANLRYHIQQTGDKCYLLSECDETWLKETGLGEVAIKTSTLPTPPRNAPGYRKTAEKSKMYRLLPAGRNTAAANHWEAVEVDVDAEDGVFVEINYFRYKDVTGEFVHPHCLRQTLEALETLGKPVEVYGIRQADRKLVDDADGQWTPLADYVKEAAKELEPQYLPLELLRAELDVLGSHYSREVNPELYTKFTFAPTSLFAEFVRETQKAAKVDVEKVTAFRRLTGFQERTWQTDRLDKMEDAVLKKYPMLKFARYASASDELQTVVDYINGIDK